MEARTTHVRSSECRLNDFRLEALANTGSGGYIEKLIVFSALSRDPKAGESISEAALELYDMSARSLGVEVDEIFDTVEPCIDRIVAGECSQYGIGPGGRAYSKAVEASE